MARKLQLSGHMENIILHTFANKRPKEIHSLRAPINLHCPDGTLFQLQANTLKFLAGPLSTFTLSTSDTTFLQKPEYRDKVTTVQVKENESFFPDLLIGLDYFWDLIQPPVTTPLPSGLVLVPTKLGYLISGYKQPIRRNIAKHDYDLSCGTQCLQSLSQILNCYPADSAVTNSCGPNHEDFWALERIGVHDCPEFNEDQSAKKQFLESVTLIDDLTGHQRYQVRFPWKYENPLLPDNFGLAMGRLRSLVTRLNKEDDTSLLGKYDTIIQDQLSKNMIEKVPTEEVWPNHIVHYLAHHAVITPLKTTTKIRIVFDGSAKCSKDALSINDCLLRGPILLPQLCGILLRFRLHPVGILADIEKAFLQIGLKQPDRDVTRFLWLKDFKSPPDADNIQVYRFTRVYFYFYFISFT